LINYSQLQASCVTVAKKEEQVSVVSLVDGVSMATCAQLCTWFL